MTTRQGPGGKIPADGRPAQAKGVGKDAKRHDLEGPKTPGLGGDLQYGEVGAAEAAAAGMKKQQQPGRPRPSRQSQAPSPTQQGGMSIPDPRGFMHDRLSRTLGGAPSTGVTPEPIRAEPWLPLLGQMATAPNSGGMLMSAYIESISRATGRHSGHVALLDMNALDQAVEESFG